MEEFRCYFLDADGHIGGREEIDADTLAGAIDQALAMITARPQHSAFEIWQGTNRVYGPELRS